MQVTHTFVSSIADDPAALAAGEVCPQSHWNANHTIAPVGHLVTLASYTMAATDDIADVNFAGSVMIGLPTSPVNFKFYTVADSSGAAQTNNITISTVSYVIGSNGGAWTGYYNGTKWVQIA